ncbi:MAG: response regulator [Phycisphaerae bacterium]
MISSRLRVLLADADMRMRQEVVTCLEQLGHAVMQAHCGADALMQCDLDPPNLLVMDVELGDMEGYEVCSQLRRHMAFADLPIIMTAQPHDDMTTQYLSQMVEFAGGDYFLSKPYDTEVLRRLIDTLSPQNGRRTGHARPSFPTRVVWPTSRVAAADMPLI